jgi:hypothetical protein
METILNEIKEERARQNKKWGEQNHSVIEWQGILMEEVGEAAKEAVDYHFNIGIQKAIENAPGCPPDIIVSDIQGGRLSRYRKELIQVAAVAVQMIECLDRNYK